MIKNRRAIIFGINSYKLNKDEKLFFKKVHPWGIILFSRNIRNLEQLKELVTEIKKFFKDVNFPILIDIEGGRVSRLNKIIDLSTFSQDYFGKIYKKNKKLFLNNYKVFVNAVSGLMNYVGANINTVPVLDVRRKKSHKIIGDRSFSNNQNEVSAIGKMCVDLYEKNKICTVIKHIPGHGAAKHDSHIKTPTIRCSRNELIKKDFVPFKKCKSFFAMTAHIIYEKYDSENTATHSKIVIKKIIRNYIKFKGIIISDDICMKSLKYTLAENATKALEAGCNLVLHCSGNLNEMRKISKVIPKIDNFTEKKTSDFYKFLR